MKVPVVATIVSALAVLDDVQLGRLEYHSSRNQPWCLAGRATRLADPPYCGLELAALSPLPLDRARELSIEALGLWEDMCRKAGFEDGSSLLEMAMILAKQSDVRKAIAKAVVLRRKAHEKSPQQDRPILRPATGASRLARAVERPRTARTARPPKRPARTA